MTDALKPCPFCGGKAEIITLQGETDEPSIGAQAVQCTNHACGAASGLVYPLMEDVTQLLRERWNTRAALAAPQPAAPAKAGCELGCSTECKAKEHGCASECPALPWQPAAPQAITDHDISDWADRHGIKLGGSDLHCAFHDAATLHMTKEADHG